MLWLPWCLFACTTVPATVSDRHDDPAPATEVSEASEPTGEPGQDSRIPVLDQLRPLDAATVFDGEVTLMVPVQLREIHPFGPDLLFEFEGATAKVEGQRKLPEPWDGQLSRWDIVDPKADPQPRAQLGYAL
ncbi:MAG: hypothetical protein KC457_34300, partial [Myxococcales bacterium]|nr:hypothetical protein [Myxococcales bacterium]